MELRLRQWIGVYSVTLGDIKNKASNISALIDICFTTKLARYFTVKHYFNDMVIHYSGFVESYQKKIR